MGYKVERRPVVTPGNVATQASTASPIPANTSVTVLGAGGSTTDKVYTLSPPGVAGIMKTIICATTGVQKATVTVGGSTATGFLTGAGGNAAGSTFRSIVFSSLSTKRRTAQLVAVSPTAWGLVAMSTGCTLAG